MPIPIEYHFAFAQLEQLAVELLVGDADALLPPQLVRRQEEDAPDEMRDPAETRQDASRVADAGKQNSQHLAPIGCHDFFLVY